MIALKMEKGFISPHKSNNVDNYYQTTMMSVELTQYNLSSIYASTEKIPARMVS